MSEFTDLLQQMAERADEVSLGDAEEIRRRGDRRRRRTTTRWAAVATGLTVLGGAWIAGRGLDESSSTPPIDHGPTHSTTAPAWNAQPLKPPLVPGDKPDLGADDYILQGLAADDNLYVMVGSTHEAGDVWLSRDGQSWAEPFPHNAPAANLLGDVTDTESGYLAVGQDRAGHPAVWSSSDGFVWTQDTLYSPDDLSGMISGIARSNNGWVAWGTVSGQGTGTDGYIWRSDDGVAWLPAGDQSVFARPGWQDIWAVEATDFGWTAFGRDETAGFKNSYARWTANADGEGWSNPKPAPDALSAEQTTMHLGATGPNGSVKLTPTADGLRLSMP
jgi:hypothetical protein